MIRRSRALRTTVGLLAAGAMLTGCATTTAIRASAPARHAAVTSPSRHAVVAPAVPAPASSTPPAHVASAPKPIDHCAHNSASKLVLVSIRLQHLWMCARHRTSYSTPVTTGMATQYTHTPTGHFHIQGINRNSVLTLNTGQQYDVKYWIPFNAPLFGFHDSSWQHFPYGSKAYRHHGSHGCVHMPLHAIAHLAQWATIGTAVTIR